MLYKPSGTIADSSTVAFNGSNELGTVNTVTFMLKSDDPDGAGGPCKADSDFVNVTIYPRPITHFSGFATEYCRNTAPVRPEGNLGYRISGNAIFTGTGVSTFGDFYRFDPGDIAIPLKGDIIPIQYKQTDANGCYNFVDTTVRVFPVPVVSYTTSSQCQFDTITFLSTSTVLNTQFPSSTMVDWDWAIDGDTIMNVFFYNLDPLAGPIVPPVYSLDTIRTKYSFLNYGLHSIHLHVASNSGGTLNCHNTKDLTQTFGPYPKTEFSWTRPCSVDSVLFLNETTIAPGYSNSISWNMNGAGTYKTPATPLLPTDTIYKFTNPGIYKVDLTATTTTYNCVKVKTKEVYVVPTYTISPSDPYDSSFATSRNWAPSGFNDQPYSWQHGMPNATKQVIKPGGGTPAWSGNKLWITDTAGVYKAGELSYLNSPCFSFSTLDKPMLVMKEWTSSTNRRGHGVTVALPTRR